MKVILDLDQLQRDGTITSDEYEKFRVLGAKSMGTLAFNLLIGFGVLGVVAGGILLFWPTPAFMTGIGLAFFTVGALLLRSGRERWQVVSTMFVLMGALSSGSGIWGLFNGSPGALLAICALLAIAGIFTRSMLLTVMATLMLSASIGAVTSPLISETGDWSVIGDLLSWMPTLRIATFSVLAVGCYWLSGRIPPDYKRIASACLKTSVLIVNAAFLVGAMNGDQLGTTRVIIPPVIYTGLWALALVITAILAWRYQSRWLLNTAATFGGILFYVQLSSYFGRTGITLFLAGTLTLGFAIVLAGINRKIKVRVSHDQG